MASAMPQTPAPQARTALPKILVQAAPLSLDNAVKPPFLLASPKALT